jgi:aminopeptidase N
MYLRMALFNALLWISIGVCAQERPSSIDPKPLPKATWKRERFIDLKHLALDLRCDWKQRRVAGVCTLELSLLKESDRVSLDAGFLLIHSVQTETGKALRFDYDGGDSLGNLTIHLDRIYLPDEVITLKISYETTWHNHADPINLGGSFGKGLRFQMPTKATPIKRKQIWSSGEAQSNRYWFPSYEVPDDLRTTAIRITVDSELTAVATGKLVELTKNKDGTTTFQFDATTPHPNYLSAMAVGDYVDVIRIQDGVVLHTLGYPDEREGIEATVVRLPEMLRYFEKATGTKFPFPQFTQVVVQDYPFPGKVGQHGCVIVSDNMIDDHRTHDDFFYLWDGIEAQGLASQWFGNLIVPRDWSHIWLSESFSRYLDAMFNIERNGLAEYLTFHADFDHSIVHADWNGGYRHPIVTDHFADLEEFASDNYAKYRGALVLHLLRRELGATQWFQLLNDYTQKHGGTLVTTQDFEAAVDAVAGRSMSWFFEQWIYGMGHPIFEISKEYDSDQQVLTLVVKQVQKPDPQSPYPQVEYFQGHVEIEIDDKKQRIWLAPKPINTISIPRKEKPKFVHFDCESSWIKEMRFEKSMDEWLAQSELSSDPLGQRAAVVKLSQIGRQETTSNEDKARIREALRRVIASDKYWRVRVRAMTELQAMLSHAQSSGPLTLDDKTKELLVTIVKNESSWLRANALGVLGATRDKGLDTMYLAAFDDPSDRVINAAAIALGKSQSPRAFDALVKLKEKPSWKNQSLISTLNGLKELRDPRGIEIALAALQDNRSARWWLATPIWDYPVAAAETLVALNGVAQAYPIVRDRFLQAMEEGDLNDIFANVLLVAILADPRGTEVFERLKNRFRDDPNAMKGVEMYEQQFNEGIKR